MELKNIEFAKAEDFSKEFLQERGLPSEGTIIIETYNSTPETKFISMPRGGIREYLISLGEFNDYEISE